VDENILENVLRMLLVRVPLLLVAGAGLLMALVRWRRHPTASLWAMLGMLVLLFVVFGEVVYYTFMPRLFPELYHIDERRQFFDFFFLSSLVWLFLDAVGVGLVVAAVFSDRQPPIDFN
jgi:uncharacterized membrane protein